MDGHWATRAHVAWGLTLCWRGGAMVTRTLCSPPVHRSVGEEAPTAHRPSGTCDGRGGPQPGACCPEGCLGGQVALWTEVCPEEGDADGDALLPGPETSRDAPQVARHTCGDPQGGASAMRTGPLASWTCGPASLRGGHSVSRPTHPAVSWVQGRRII